MMPLVLERSSSPGEASEEPRRRRREGGALVFEREKMPLQLLGAAETQVPQHLWVKERCGRGPGAQHSEPSEDGGRIRGASPPIRDETAL